MLRLHFGDTVKYISKCISFYPVDLSIQRPIFRSHLILKLIHTGYLCLGVVMRANFNSRAIRTKELRFLIQHKNQLRYIQEAAGHIQSQ